MSDRVLMFPNALQPAAAFKTYAPFGIRFWESEETVLGGMKQFADGWFARRQAGTQAALEAARSLGEAQGPLDVLRIYQDWFGGATARLVEDGLAFQSQFLNAATKAGAAAPATRQPEPTASSTPDTPRSLPEEQRSSG